MADKNTTIRQVISQLITVLNTRNRDVISRRFGLKSGSKETLESIGQTYGITRERVRQIEEASVSLIRENLKKDGTAALAPFVTQAGSIIQKHGGVINEQELFEEFSGSGKESPANAALVFGLILAGPYVRVMEDDDYKTFWAYSNAEVQNFKTVVTSFVSSLQKEQRVMPEAAVADFSKTAGKNIDTQTLGSILSISKQVGRNVFNEIGLTSSAEISPRGVRDKSFLVLKKEGKPKHFREITQLINTAKFSDRKAHMQTVHNELIKDDRFVLVGRGIYGLSEWGFKAGTVKDIMVDLMKSAPSPMHKKEIIAQVLSHRMVKENTIALNLQDSKTFTRHEDGRYSLREA